MLSNKSTPAEQVLEGSKFGNTRLSTLRRERRLGGTKSPYIRTPASRNIEPRKSVKGNAKSRPLQPSAVRPQAPSGRRANLLEPEPYIPSDFCKKTWKLYRLTPLYSFHYTKKHFKHYARLLTAHIESAARKAASIGGDEQLDIKATISVIEGVKVHDGEPDAVKIEVRSKAKLDKDDEPSVVLSALLCSVDIPDESQDFVLPEFTYFPVMLVKGSINLMNHLITFLQRHFDCSCQPFILDSVQLFWMVAMWSGFVTGSRNVDLEYQVPEQVEGISKINLEINASDCKRLWDCVKGEGDAKVMVFDEVEKFMKGIEEHFFTLLKIYLSTLQLVQVSTSIACIGSKFHRLKIFSADHVAHILQHLTVLSWEFFQYSQGG